LPLVLHKFINHRVTLVRHQGLPEVSAPVSKEILEDTATEGTVFFSEVSNLSSEVLRHEDTVLADSV
jgi:hypothetical protein